MTLSRRALITGGAGFFGGILKRRLLGDGWNCVSVDLCPDEDTHPELVSIQGDLKDPRLVSRLFANDYDSVFHCAAVLGHAVRNKEMLWASNVTATENLAEQAALHGVSRFVFISSNCLWGRAFDRPVLEEDIPEPVEIYGRSKLAAEQALARYRDLMATIVLRVPTIIDAGRLGLLAILFEFIADGRRVWIVGSGGNRYQFIFGPDLAEACLLAARHGESDTFNIGSDDVPTLCDVYQWVIDRAGTGARVTKLPERTARLAMRAADRMGVSPLGPYHYRMISEDFIFDTNKAKKLLGWHPTVNNKEMLWRAYEHYLLSRDAPADNRQISAHRQPSRMGVIRLLKWIS